MATIILIYMHAALGGIALLFGGIALVVKKGSSRHKKSGKVFFYSMLFSAISALVIASLPGHLNPFLFSIGLFSSYFILSGYKALAFKEKEASLMTYKALGVSILFIGTGMIAIPYLTTGTVNIVLLVFGVFSIIMGIGDLKQVSHPLKLRKKWLRIHLGKMTGGYISAVSAFCVVNQVFPGIWNWFLPGLIGGVFIFSQLKKRETNS